jgi:hypothetical protein
MVQYWCPKILRGRRGRIEVVSMAYNRSILESWRAREVRAPWGPACYLYYSSRTALPRGVAYGGPGLTVGLPNAVAMPPFSSTIPYTPR